MRKRPKAILGKALIIALLLVLVWEVVALVGLVRSTSDLLIGIDNHLSSIETMTAPGGPIDRNLSSIETKVAPDTSPGPTP